MANWKFWQRNSRSQNSELPEEVREYYESQSQSRGKAILVGVSTLIVTLLIAAGLFFSGRAIVGWFSDDSEPTNISGVLDDAGRDVNVVTEDQADQNQNESEDNAGAGETLQDPATADELPGNNSGDIALEGEVQGEVEADDETETPSSTTRERSPQTGSTEVPDTGPGSTLAIFVATILVSALLHNAYQRVKATE